MPTCPRPPISPQTSCRPLRPLVCHLAPLIEPPTDPTLQCAIVFGSACLEPESAEPVLPELEAPCSGGWGPAAQNHGPRGALGGQLAQDSIDSLGGSPRDQSRSQALLRQHQGRVWGNWQPAPELSELGSQVSGARKHPNLLRGQSWSRGSSPTARAPTPCPTVPPAARGQSWSSSLWKWGCPGPAARSPPPLALQGGRSCVVQSGEQPAPQVGPCQ